MIRQRSQSVNWLLSKLTVNKILDDYAKLNQ